jgi:hypothetical protein
VPFDEGPDAELGGEPLGQGVLRAHRLVEVIEAELGDEADVRQVEERRHPPSPPVGPAVW